MQSLKIRNIVATANLNTNIDLKRLREKCNLQLNSKKSSKLFNAAIMKQIDPVKSTCLVFANGKLVCTGADSVDKIKEALQSFLRKIEEALQIEQLELAEFKIQNIVSTYSFDHKINLYKFHSFYPTKCTYEPELFPGLSYKFEKGVSAQIFNSGKIVITGPKTFEQLSSVFNEIELAIAFVFED